MADDVRRTEIAEARETDTVAPREDVHAWEATKVVDRYTWISGAVGLIPVPLLDIAALGGVQLLMLRRLARIYGVEFSEHRGKSLIASTVSSIVPVTTGTTTAAGVASALKAIPGGTAVAVLTMPAFAAGATYILGKVFIQHFASGGTLLDFDPAEYREFIRSHRETSTGTATDARASAARTRSPRRTSAATTA